MLFRMACPSSREGTDPAFVSELPTFCKMGLAHLWYRAVVGTY